MLFIVATTISGTTVKLQYIFRWSINVVNTVIHVQMAVESEEGDIDLLNDETFGDGAVGEW